MLILHAPRRCSLPVRLFWNLHIIITYSILQNNELNWLKAMKIETGISTYSVDPASTLALRLRWLLELSNIRVVFECGQPGLQSSTLHYPFILAVVGGRGQTFKIDKSVPLGPVFN